MLEVTFCFIHSQRTVDIERIVPFVWLHFDDALNAIDSYRFESMCPDNWRRIANFPVSATGPKRRNPQLIPGRPSHGCVRLRNADITRLWPLVEVGTPIEIV